MNITHSERKRYDGVGINGVLAVKGAGDGWTDKIEKEEIRPEEVRFSFALATGVEGLIIFSWFLALLKSFIADPPQAL